MKLIKRYVLEFANDQINTYKKIMKDQEPDIKKLWQKKIDETSHIKRITQAGMITNYEAMKSIIEINDRQIVLKKKVVEPITFYVAECGEFHSKGYYRENIKSLDEAMRVYQGIDVNRMHSIPEVGFMLKEGSIYDDLPCPLIRGHKIDETYLTIPAFKTNEFVQKAAKECREKYCYPSSAQTFG